MNRAQRRQLKATVKHMVKTGSGLDHPVPDSVVLNGGPMDGWIVKPEADALRPDWHTTWNTNIAPSLVNWVPGRYVRAADGKSATWASEIEVVTE
jgi:hypothetical protein